MADAILSMSDAREYALMLGATDAFESDGLLCVQVSSGSRVEEYRFAPHNLYRPFMSHEIRRMLAEAVRGD